MLKDLVIKEDSVSSLSLFRDIESRHQWRSTNRIILMSAIALPATCPTRCAGVGVKVI
jgi:hypothetical protein